MKKSGEKIKSKKLKETKKEEYIEISGMMGNETDYHVYHMTKMDYLVSFSAGFILASVVIYAFFQSLICIVVGGLLFAWFLPRYYQEYKKHRRLGELRLQFKDLLESLTASYSAGRNTVDAFSDAANDMISIYGEGADIVKELQTVCTGLKNNINIEALLINFADRSGLDDIMSFANVFEVCNRQGSDLKRVVSETRDIIGDKIDIEMEIETMLSGNKNELNIMMVMPVVIVLMLRGFGGISITVNTPVNLVVKMICIGIFILAYVMGRKIVDIKI